MSEHTPTAADGDPDPEPPSVPLYAALELVDDALVVYDEHDHRGWIQSDTHVRLADCA